MEQHRLTLSTHNINGFARHKDFLQSRCSQEPDTIHCLQEHWLLPSTKHRKGVNELCCVHKDFDGYGTSAMKKAVESRILKGRPFGGTGFLWNRKFSNSIRPRHEYVHERVGVLQISDSRHNILCINVYFPYLDTSKLTEQLALYNDAIGFIDNVMMNNRECKFVIAGDFNCNLYDQSHPFTPLIRDFMSRHNLTCCFDVIPNFDSNSTWTRTCQRGGRSHNSLLDYVQDASY